ncbi:hypothetical protein INT45_013800 [Circinella minor]|uniref:Uncharacterized protein n=1 Tax=Circinella minor TaxID=1195481 RepID=A0A8H7RS70_9FUNG|nr:hypothetical protein INT45_013800 [Circinella minor]
MPPKSNVKVSVQQELQELRRQVTNISHDQETLYTAQNELAGAIRELKQEFKSKTEEILNAINDLKEVSMSHITRSMFFRSLPSDAASVSTNSTLATISIRPTARNNFAKSIILAPRKTVIFKGKRKQVKAKITKNYIIKLVIQNDINPDMSYSQAEAIYNTVIQERRLALKLLPQRLVNNGQETLLDDEIGDEKIKIGWGSINENERKTTIDGFKDAVFERRSVNLRLCEEDWAALHMLSEGWGNRRQQEQTVRKSRGIGEAPSPQPSSPQPQPPSP